MAGYGWTNYDVREGGRQIINDSRNRVDMITDFVKVSKDGHHGGWGARITGVPRAHRPQTEQISVIIYLGSQDPASKTECMRGSADESSSEGILCTGTTLGFDNYKLRIPYQPFDNSTYQRQSLKSSSVPANSIWNAKTIFIENLQESDSGNKFITNAPGEGNLHFLQQNFEGEFEFDVLFSTNAEVSPMTSSSFTKGVQGLLSRFEKRFRSVYEPRAPFENEQHVKFSQSLLSNLMGGTGYFDGTSKVAASSALEDAEIGEDSWKKASSNQSSGAVQERGPFKLMSTVPSRPFFPRGFLWDEGFHLQVILDWDMDFALDIFSSWLDLMDEEGWIAREQILGPEVRSKVPQEFQIQYQHYANPPTLFFVIREFVARLRGTISYSGAPSRYLGDPEAGKTLLTAIFEKSLRHYRWFRRTQVGNTSRYDVPGSESAEGYRWRGWTAQHILTSGLDDYPRVQPPHPEGLHLDALCWTGLMAIVLKDTAAFLGKNKIQSDLSSEEAAIIYSIETLHWSELDRAYCDTTISEDQQVKRVCHKGYISLYPFFLGLVRNDTHLEDVMDLIQDSGELWSPYGLRSLGLQDQYYGTGENYWKGPIWINVNYMVLQSLLVSTQCDHKIFSVRFKSGALSSHLSGTVTKGRLASNKSAQNIHPASIKSCQDCV